MLNAWANAFASIYSMASVLPIANCTTHVMWALLSIVITTPDQKNANHLTDQAAKVLYR